MTGGELADQLGVSQAFISMVRHGKKRPGLDVMLRVEAEHGIDLREQLTARNEGRYLDFIEARLQAVTS